MTVTASTVSCFGDNQMWPPGFRFHPTDEELVLYYLKRKICKRKLKLDIIRETDVYKWDPEELPAQSLLKSGDRQWFFFTPRDRKYPNGARSNRATEHGYWKATGKDRAVTCNSWTVGVKKTLVFYRGRAPSGERTDWVMHEYTLDEEELKRCQNVREYYALYKLYQKSGPGPKNGEQYGAPFKEEEWADEEYTDNPVDSITPEKPPNEANSDDNVKANDQVQSLLNDDEEFVRQLIDEPALPLPQAHFGYVLPQAVGVGETQSTLVDPSLRDVHFPEPRVVLHDQTSFEFSQSPTSQLKLHESPEVTSVPDHFEQVPQFREEDYLEIDDISSSELLNSYVVEPVEKGQQFNEMDEPSELDLYHEPVMYLQDNGPIDQGAVPFYENMINHVSYSLESQSNISLIDQQLQPQSNTNLMDQQLQPQSNINLMDQQLQHQSNINLMDQQLQYQSNAFGDNQLSQSQFNVVGDNQHLQHQSNAFGDNQLSQSQFNVVGDTQHLQHQSNAFGDNQQSQSQFNVVGDNQHLQSRLNALGNNMLYQVGYQSPSLSNINLVDQQWIPHSTADQVSDQLQFRSVGNELDQHLHMDQMNGSLWTHDQSANVFTASGSNLGSVSPTSGLVDNGINQGQSDKSGSDGGSRFSSAMWSLVESIPTTPASASEGPLGNRAFERTSSFSRLKLNARITDISAVNGAATAKRSRGFFFISILGASCAILWFLIGTGWDLRRCIS